MNVQILEHQSDSIRRELNAAITGVAVSNDNTFNINPAMMLPKTSGIKKQIDVQTNTAILTQLVANLEIARVSLRKETPLIQIIDSPIFPLQKDKLGKKMALALGAIAGGILSVLYFVLLFWYKERK
jgi:LPS O-antigen subunit length determinant protein (WzzB/FepE family)